MEKMNIILLAIILLYLFTVCFTMPKNTNYKSKVQKVKNVDFLYDLTYEKDGEIVREQNIFAEVFKEIDEAEKFLIVDMFLYNDDYNRKYTFPDLANQLTEKLINKKKNNKEIKIYVITDPINTFYGAYDSKFLERLKKENIEVIMTNLNRLRDSHPSYSISWRIFFRWFGTRGKGWIPSPFSPQSPKVTLRSYLKLLNFKANHRKVVISEKRAIVSSANPHDGSGYHSNIAFAMNGEIINDFVVTEKAVSDFSKGNIDIEKIEFKEEEDANIELVYLTEKKILDSILEEIKKTEEKDDIKLSMFYFSHRKIMKELIKASNRGVDVRIILDANKDAFGREKNGVPNRMVANEMVKKTDGKIKLRWYNTQGEQFHTKMLILNNKTTTTIIGGSSNYTRRNLNNYNLESDIMIKVSKYEKLSKEVNDYFERIYNNKDGKYTLDYKEFEENGLIKGAMYRFQEWSGVSTF